jgi:hypothetical protein
MEARYSSETLVVAVVISFLLMPVFYVLKTVFLRMSFLQHRGVYAEISCPNTPSFLFYLPCLSAEINRLNGTLSVTTDSGGL